MTKYLHVLLGAGLLTGAFAAGDRAAQAATAGYFHQTTVAVALPAKGGTLATIRSVAVPAGNWAITGKAQIVNFGATDIGRCYLLVGGVVVDSSGSELGGGSNFPAVAVLVTQYAFTASASTLVQLACSHDADITGEYVDPSASLMILPMPAGTIR